MITPEMMKEMEAVTVNAAHVVGKTDALFRGMMRHRMEQQEAFLSGHLDKIGTHTLYTYPETWEETETGTTHEQLLVLVPKDFQGDLLPAEAMDQFPYVVVRWVIVMAIPGKPFKPNYSVRLR